MKPVHLTNKELRAARAGGPKSLQSDLQEHLRVCEECSLALSFLKAFPVSGRLLLVDAPSYVISKAIQIPIERNKRSIARQIIDAATMLFDSWTTPVPVGVRSSVRSSRRLRYSSPHCQLDLQTTRAQQGWDCTARIVSDVATSSDLLAIRVDRQRYPVDHSGFVTWKSSRPPQMITVTQGTSVILRAEVVWSDRSPL
jgi:hypothetical protein